MKKLILVLLMVCMMPFAGCKKIVKEESGILHEDAIVLARIYTPSKHETNLEMTMMKSGMLGIGYSGEMGIRVGNGMQITESIVPEIYGILFQCQHGTFTSQGSDIRHKNLYDRLKEGQKVDITYKEIYKDTYDDTNDDGKKELISRVLVDMDFIDAK